MKTKSSPAPFPPSSSDCLFCKIVSGTIPAGQRATDASLRARLTAALDRNKQLADDNARLRRLLARALGDERMARTRSGNNPAP